MFGTSFNCMTVGKSTTKSSTAKIPSSKTDNSLKDSSTMPAIHTVHGTVFTKFPTLDPGGRIARPSPCPCDRQREVQMCRCLRRDSMLETFPGRCPMEAHQSKHKQTMSAYVWITLCKIGHQSFCYPFLEGSIVQVNSKVPFLSLMPNWWSAGLNAAVCFVDRDKLMVHR